MLIERPIAPVQRDRIADNETVRLGVIARLRLFAEAYRRHLVIAFERMVGVAQINLLCGLLAVLTGVTVLREVDKRHDVIDFVRAVDLEQVDCRLHGRLAAEQVVGHVDACNQRVLLQNPLRVHVALTASSILLNQHRAVPRLHARKRLINEDKTFARCRVGWV